MRKNLIILLAIALFSCKSDNDGEAGKEKIKSLLASFHEAMAKKDLKKMKELTATNFVMFDEGVIYNNESALSSIEKLPPFTATFSFDSLNVYMAGNNASAYYLKEAVFTKEGHTYPPAHFLESATFNKENGEWKIRFLHSSRKN